MEGGGGRERERVRERERQKSRCYGVTIPTLLPMASMLASVVVYILCDLGYSHTMTLSPKYRQTPWGRGERKRGRSWM